MTTYTKNSIKDIMNKKIKDIEFNIDYHLECYEDSLKELIKIQEEYKEYGFVKYETKWLQASLDFITGQKSLLKLSRVPVKQIK